MSKYLVILFFLCLGSSEVLSQKETKERATREINQLQEGNLIVRLKNRELTYLALEKQGKSKDAVALRNADLQENLSIISGFTEEFDFCKVYFIDPLDSELVSEENFDAIVFLDADGKKDPSIRLDANLPTFTSEFSLVDFSQVEHKDGMFYHYDDTGKLLITEDYHHYEFSFPALIIKDLDFVQLESPFPFYVKTLETIPLLARSRSRVIEKLNEELHYWHNRGFN